MFNADGLSAKVFSKDDFVSIRCLGLALTQR
jgi:hypothetical protein